MMLLENNTLLVISLNLLSTEGLEGQAPATMGTNAMTLVFYY